jgi:hypothetical protein
VPGARREVGAEELVGSVDEVKAHGGDYSPRR